MYWSLNADGSVADSKKQFYAIAFTVYGLAEYYRATADDTALQQAIELFRCIERHSRDNARGGYREAATREWEPIEDMRLSEKDRNFSKTMKHPSPHSGGVHRSAESVAHRRVSGGGAQYPFGDD